MHATDIWEQPWIPCEHCPHPTPEACPSRHHRRYCDLVHPDRPGSERAAARLAALSPEHRPGRAVAFVPDPVPEPPARRDAPRPPRASPAPTEARTEPAAPVLWTRLVRACPHRTPVERPSSCGCVEPALCGLGKHDDGRDVVSITRTCRACVTATDPPSAPPAT